MTIRNLFEQLLQILKHGVFFFRARAIGNKELLAQVQCLSLHCSGTKPIPYRSQELISVPLIFSRVPCVTNRSRRYPRNFTVYVACPIRSIPASDSSFIRDTIPFTDSLRSFVVLNR